MKRIDVHLHIPADNTLGENFSPVADMLPHLDELGIDYGILLSISTQWNQQSMQNVAQYPDRFSWMCHVEPGLGNVEEQLKKAKEQGAVGIGEATYNKWIEDDFIQRTFRAAEKLNMPILFHMSPEEGYSYGICDKPGLPMLEDSLKKYPDLKFIGHSQTFWIEMSGDAPADKESRNQWGSGPVTPGGRIPYLFENYPNLYGDLSANSGGQAIMRDEENGLAFLTKYADRLFFGTDMFNADMTFPLAKWLDDMHEKGRLSTDTYEKICWKNAEKLIKGQL
ncbi:MAG: amidohydrolase family protein [Oscillospiraceae bacterium]|nr:amidohydrolase family protein [Oscillospiraceae bacterium]